MISGFSGLPKLRLSVAAIGSAPTAVRLRQHSAHRLLAALEGVGLAIARRHVRREGERLGRVALDADHARIAAGPLQRIALDLGVVLLIDPAPRAEGRRAEQLQQRVGDRPSVECRSPERTRSAAAWSTAGHIPAPRRPAA